ncbi:hypothetical protein MRS44_017639 [Fusarium solani]|uniref:uncharacterized protein n=1 Tax=Fusarium solani TaxID=169388 RepID=UPI0032C416F1|nr:hypothetical protein MRS44_017639 [Fusarium solani]
MEDGISSVFPRDVYAQVPLDAAHRGIRLIKLYPGIMTEPIVGDLEAACLDSPEPCDYTALSYAWGDSTFLQPISVNGRLFGITPNLHAALKYIRSPTEPMVLWVDSMCIDQGSTSEMSKQVPMMRDIYQLSKRVIAWLGEADSAGGHAMDYIASSVWEQESPPGHLQLALDSLFSRPYWTRVWVVQEVAAAKDVTLMYGHKSLPFERLGRFLVETRKGNVHLDGAGYWRPRDMFLLTTAIRGETDPATVLRDASRLNATRPVDKIYGLFGLFPAAFRERLNLDYRKTYSAVLIDFCKTYLDVYRNLGFLTLFSPCSGAGPSWVPDIWQRLRGLTELYNTPGRNRQTNAAISGDTLTAPGVCMGKIVESIGPFETRFSHLKANYHSTGRLQGDGNAAFADMERLAMSHLRRRYSPAQRDAAFFQLLAGDRSYFQSSRLCPESCRDLWSVATEVERSGPSAKFETHASSFEFIFIRLRGRSLFVTDQGLVGLGPGNLRAGDMVCALWGCRLPVLLRSLPGEDGEYTFLGPAYVDGAMSGEYALGENEAVFRIR